MKTINGHLNKIAKQRDDKTEDVSKKRNEQKETTRK